MPPELSITEAEDARAFELAQARAAAEETAAITVSAATAPRVGGFELGLMLGLAVFNDALDYFVVGSIPVVGDLLDGFTWGTIALWVTTRGLERPDYSLLMGAIEMIPLGDLLPTFTLQVLWIVSYNNKKAKSNGI